MLTQQLPTGERHVAFAAKAPTDVHDLRIDGGEWGRVHHTFGYVDVTGPPALLAALIGDFRSDPSSTITNTVPIDAVSRQQLLERIENCE